jgi:hypothetical protein
MRGRVRLEHGAVNPDRFAPAQSRHHQPLRHPCEEGAVTLEGDRGRTGDIELANTGSGRLRLQEAQASIESAATCTGPEEVAAPRQFTEDADSSPLIAKNVGHCGQDDCASPNSLPSPVPVQPLDKLQRFHEATK